MAEFLKDGKPFSGVVGRATVYFGGKVALGVTANKDSDEPTGIAICELLDEKGAGDKILPSDLNFGTQVRLMFPNLESLQVMRTAIDDLEVAMKSWVRTQMEEEQGKEDEL